MSELKYQLMLNKDMSWVPCYLKSEADKVIADKDKEIAELKKEKEYVIEHTAEVINGQERELSRQKYKRCLAMAMWCRTSARCDEGLGAFKYRDWYWKWHKRWLTLADKYKEGNV